MSFNFKWPTFSEDYYSDARDILEQALNKGTKPPIIADRIEVKELNMGTLPPELEILEIGDLSTDRFRGIFRLTYAGDAYIVLQTKVQANPLNVPRPSLDVLGTPRILFAAAPLVVPMTLRLSSLSLRAIVVLVVSRQKGITLVFKNDPLESVQVSSSFDGVDSVAGYIQNQIEHQLREAFRSDLPGVIHRLSQKWLSGEVKSATEGVGASGGGAVSKGGRGGFEKDAKIETRTAYVPGAPNGVSMTGMNGVGLGQGREGRARGRGLTTRMESMSISGESVSINSDADTAFSIRTSPTLGRSTRRSSINPPPPPTSDGFDSVPESIESYDPTYGLRPDSIPLHAGFADYERLVRSTETGRGLGDILGVEPGDDDDEMSRGESSLEYPYGPDDSYDLVGLIDLVDDGSGTQVPKWDHHPYHHHHLLRNHLQEDDEDLFGYGGGGAAGGMMDGGMSNAGYDASAYETIPAVGGGTITRPRVFHTQSQMRTRTESSGSLSAHGSPSTTTTARPGVPASSSSTIGGATFSPNPSHQQSPLPPFPHDGRQDYFGGMSSSGTATPMTPRLSGRTYGGVQYSPAPSIIRSTSFAGIGSAGLSYVSQPRVRSSLQRSTTVFSSASTSPENTRRSSSLFPSTLGSSSSAATTVPSSTPEEEEETEVPPFAAGRPDPIDLLSRSPSSILNTSYDEALPITLNPTRNDSCAHLATLTSSNQTLSPFTRAHEHFTARSSPHVFAAGAGAGVGVRGISPRPTPGLVTPSAMAAGGGPPVKAIRKRIHRLSSAKPSAPASVTAPPSPTQLPTNLPRLPATRSLPVSVARSVAPSEMSDYFPNVGMVGVGAATAALRNSAGMGVWERR
ncbi:hypothetical protein T439DRAFT_383784 [Meredithblackwellia eburnea MCA 4105]